MQGKCHKTEMSSTSNKLDRQLPPAHALLHERQENHEIRWKRHPQYKIFHLPDHPRTHMAYIQKKQEHPFSQKNALHIKIE